MQIRQTPVEKTAWLPTLVLRPLMWLGRHEFGVLVAVAGLTGGAWLFVVIGDEIMEGGTQAIDRTWLLGIRKFGYQNAVLGPALHEWARDITALGGIPVLALLTLIATGFLFLNGKRRMAYFICASIASGLFLFCCSRACSSELGLILRHISSIWFPPAFPADTP
jgi:undecaprenyl-diphosphatase